MISVSEAYRHGMHCDYVPGIAYNDGVNETPVCDIKALPDGMFQIALMDNTDVIVPGGDLLAEFDTNYYGDETVAP